MKEVAESIEDFNRHRKPEAVAKLISADDEIIKVEFSGSFCQSCGFYDYFDDLKFIFEEKGIDTEVGEVQETEEGGIVEFRIC